MDIRCKYCNRKFFEVEIIKKDDDKTLIIINIRCNRCKQINRLSVPSCFIKNQDK